MEAWKRMGSYSVVLTGISFVLVFLLAFFYTNEEVEPIFQSSEIVHAHSKSFARFYQPQSSNNHLRHFVQSDKILLQSFSDAPSLTSTSSSSSSSSPQQRIIVKNSELSLQVSDIQEMCQRVQLMVPKMTRGVGWISEIDIRESLRIYIVLRVPSTMLDDFLVSLKCAFCEHFKLGENISIKVLSERTHGQDFTEEFYDLQSRLKSLSSTREQLYLVLQKATLVPEILAVHTQLEELNHRIEILMGRKKYLEDSSSMSTIRLELFSAEAPPVTPPLKWDPLTTIQQTVKSMRKFCIYVADLLLQVLLFSIPLAFLALVFYLLSFFCRALTHK